MKDGVIKGDGTSRLAKASGWPETYEGFKALAESSGIPLDLIFNSSGWQQLPTFLMKATLLQDFTAQLLGLDPDDNPTVDDAFLNTFLTASGAGLIKVQVYETGTETPIGGVLVTGIKDLLGNDLYTDDTGLAIGLAESETSTFKVSTDYIDLSDQTEFSGETPAQKVTEAIIYATRVSNPSGKVETFTSSVQKMFTDKVKRVDVHCVGAGAGGSSGYSGWNNPDGGYGGGGGKSVYQNNVSFTSNELFSVVIGAGGTGGTGVSKSGDTDDTVSGNRGNYGGESSCLGVTAAGGTPNATRGASANYSTGENTQAATASANTTSLFGETSLGIAGGGNGGGGGASVYYNYTTESANSTAGGSPKGGSGGNNNTAGTNGSSPGGGGGGGATKTSQTTGQNMSFSLKAGGDGGDGGVYIRWWY